MNAGKRSTRAPLGPFSFVEQPEARRKLLASEPRIRRAYAELFAGYDLTAEGVLNEVVRVRRYSGLVKVENISFYSFCEHHFAPFFGTANVVYEPRSVITGLGKIVRLVRDVHARRLQIQEMMTRDIALDIVRVLKAKGAYVSTSAKHLCICSRGPGDDTTFTTVNYGVGSLERLGTEKPASQRSAGPA